MDINSAWSENDISILKNNIELWIASNSLPDHEIGKFPNRADPYFIREQRIEFCVPANPLKISFQSLW